MTTLPAIGTAGAAVAPIVPRTTQEISDYVDFLISAEMIPASYATMPANKRRGAMMVAVIKGLEVGLPPLRALQSIYVVNNIPTLYGDALPAFVWASGKLEWIKEQWEGSGDARKAIVTVKRLGSPEPVTREFSTANAAAQKLLGKTGPWQHSRDRMMMIRARTYAFRDVFADVLDGFAIAEEQEDIARSRGLEPLDMGRATLIDPLADDHEPAPETQAAEAAPGPAANFVTQAQQTFSTETETAVVEDRQPWSEPVPWSLTAFERLWLPMEPEALPTPSGVGPKNWQPFGAVVRELAKRALTNPDAEAGRDAARKWVELHGPAIRKQSDKLFSWVMEIVP